MGDMPVAVALGEEQQIADLERRLDRVCHRILHIGISLDLHADPLMQKPRQPGTIDPVAARSPPKVRNTDQPYGIREKRFSFLLRRPWKRIDRAQEYRRDPAGFVRNDLCPVAACLFYCNTRPADHARNELTLTVGLCTQSIG